METTFRSQRVSVKDELFQYAKQFSFEMAVYILDCYTRVSFGRETSIAKASVRTVSVLAFHLRATEVEKIADNLNKPVIYVSRLALAGLNAPLPTPYAARAIRQYYDGDHSMAAFLNIFNSRLLGISYRISQRRYFTLQKKNRWMMLKCIANLLGEHDIPKQMTRLAYLFWSRGHTIEGLRILIEGYFHLKTEIYTVCEHWEPLQDIVPLGGNRLGYNAYLGRHASLKRFCVKIRVTHDNPEVIFNLLANNEAFLQLKKLIKKYIGPLIVCKMEIVPSFTSDLNFQCVLGHNSWLKGNFPDALRIIM